MTFSLSNRSECERFDTLFVTTQRPPIPSILAPAWDRVSERADLKNLMASILDLQLTFLFMNHDTQDSGGSWNSLFAGKTNDNSALASASAMSGKLTILRAQNAFVLRTRAFWDKYMGFLVMYYEPGRYQLFCDARSRFRAFFQIAESWSAMDASHQYWMLLHLQGHPDFRELVDQHFAGQFLTKMFLDMLRYEVRHLDNQFRTAEAHGTGRLRKVVLADTNLGVSEIHDTIGPWNFALIMMNGVAGMFVENEPHKLRELDGYTRKAPT